MKRRTNTVFAILFGITIIGICALIKQISTREKKNTRPHHENPAPQGSVSFIMVDRANNYLFIARQAGYDREMLRLVAKQPA